MRERVNCRCGVEPGEFHVLGECGVERCPMCGLQAISCDCIYRICGYDPEDLATTSPELYNDGATEKMIQKWEDWMCGCRMPWTGIHPGMGACEEFGLFARLVPGEGWVKCDREHPDAVADINALITTCRWNPVKQKWERESAVTGAKLLS